MSLQERGVYREIMDALYLNGGKVPADLRQLGRMIGVQSLSERKAMAMITETFLTKIGEFFTQKRVQNEIERIQAKSEKYAENARAKSIKNNDLTLAIAKPPPNNGSATADLTNNLKPITNKLASSDEEFCREEILPSNWHDVAEKRNIPDEQIYISWRKFKDTTGIPYQLSRWKAWVERERIAA